MARIRTIKPEFWDSPGTARASLRARLFFIAMWNWADDYGIGTANGKQLVGFAFPNDDDITAKDFPTLAKEVSDCFGVVYFEHEGRPYFTVPSWDKHQRTERKAKRNDELIAAAERAVLARNHAEVETSDGGVGISDAMQGSSGVGKGTGEQGNRGTGEREITPLTPQRGELVTLPTPFDQVWETWPKKTEKDRSEKEYRKHSKAVPELAALIAKFGRAYAETTERQFIPSLAAWLHRKRWTDELPQSAGGSRVQAGLSVADELRRMEQGYEA